MVVDMDSRRTSSQASSALPALSHTHLISTAERLPLAASFLALSQLMVLFMRRSAFYPLAYSISCVVTAGVKRHGLPPVGAA